MNIRNIGSFLMVLTLTQKKMSVGRKYGGLEEGVDKETIKY